MNTVFTRDQFTRDLQIAMGGHGSHGTFVLLYLNGQFWGLYNLVERPDDAFQATYFSGDEDDYFSGKHRGGTIQATVLRVRVRVRAREGRARLGERIQRQPLTGVSVTGQPARDLFASRGPIHIWPNPG